MANVDSIKGATVISGDPGKIKRMIVGTVNTFVGDIVKYEGSASSDGMYPTVIPITADTDNPCGIVVSIDFDPADLVNQYAVASSGTGVFVQTDPLCQFVMQFDSATDITAADTGLNFLLVYTTGNTTTGWSQQEVDESSGAITANSYPVRFKALLNQADNVIGTHAKGVFMFNAHIDMTEAGTTAV